MDLLLQLQAEQSRTPVARPRSLESTAVGAATLAGLVEGVWGSLEELAALWEADTVFSPGEPTELADAAHAKWTRAVEKSMGWAAERLLSRRVRLVSSSGTSRHGTRHCEPDHPRARQPRSASWDSQPQVGAFNRSRTAMVNSSIDSSVPNRLR